MAISTVTNSATGTQLATAINALIAFVENTTYGNAALSTKMTEVYSQFAFPSESDDNDVTYEIPATEISVTISAVARTFTFNVARFTYAGTTYTSSTVVSHIGEGSGANYTAAVALITALVAAGSVIIDDEGSGILTETTA